MSEYQGWTNYETWNVALWIDNDRGTYEMVKEWASEVWEEAERDGYSPYLNREQRATYLLAEQIKELVKDGNPLLDRNASMYTDLLIGAISEVNWSEIAKSRIEEVEKEVTP